MRVLLLELEPSTVSTVAAQLAAGGPDDEVGADRRPVDDADLEADWFVDDGDELFGRSATAD